MGYLEENTTPEQHLIDLRIRLEFFLKVFYDNPQSENEPVTQAELANLIEDIVADLP